MLEENVKIAQQFFAALNAHDLAAMDSLRTTDFESETSSGRMDTQRNRRYVQNLITAFPDLKFQITHIIPQDNFVVVNWIANGTHDGEFHTPAGAMIAPTGKSANVSGSHTFEIEDGKIAHAWFYTNLASLLTQLGLMPPM